MVSHRRSADAHRRNRRRQRDCARALHIVVERAHPIAVFLQNAASVAGRKVLPLQQRFREQLGHGLDVGIDESVVALAADARMPVPDIHRILEQAFPIGADIQHHWNHARGIDSARRGINRQLADRDFDAAHAPIAQSQNLLGVGGQDQVDVFGSGAKVRKSRFDPIQMVDGEVHAARPAALMVILLHRHAYRQIVDDRDHLAQVPRQQTVEQHLITVMQRGEVDVLVERIGKALVLGIGRLHLLHARC